MPLKQVLSLADTLSPAVFKATLSQLTSWWNSRNRSEITLDVGERNYTLRVNAPKEATILLKGVEKNPAVPPPLLARELSVRLLDLLFQIPKFSRRNLHIRSDKLSMPSPSSRDVDEVSYLPVYAYIFA